MRKFSVITLTLAIATALFLGIAQNSLGDYTTTVDVPSGVAFELEFQLWDIDFMLSNSYALVDNVYTMDTGGSILEMVDFEDGTLQGFDDSLNPDSVDVVAGGLPGTTGSSWMMRIDEDPAFWPTITWRGFLPLTAAKLRFSFSFITTSADDEFQAYLWDDAGNPLIGGVGGAWDPVIMYQTDNLPPVTVAGGETVPISVLEPSAILLLITGLAGMSGYSGVRLHRKRKK